MKFARRTGNWLREPLSNRCDPLSRKEVVRSLPGRSVRARQLQLRVVRREADAQAGEKIRHERDEKGHAGDDGGGAVEGAHRH